MQLVAMLTAQDFYPLLAVKNRNNIEITEFYGFVVAKLNDFDSVVAGFRKWVNIYCEWVRIF